MADKSAIEWAAFLAQVRPLPLCGKHGTYRVFCIFPPVSVGLGQAAGGALFGLIGFRCETRAARRTQALDASRHTCAQARVGKCVLSVRGVGQATLQPLVRVGSQRARAWGGPEVRL